MLFVFSNLVVMTENNRPPTVDTTRMPVVDFEKDNVHQYLVDQAKAVEKDNFRRFAAYKRKLIGGRLSMLTLCSFALSIYGYTMYAVKHETFLDNFDEPTRDEDYLN